jgi:L-ascorbate metabolism protein UlaG (beta-lactamase superfamily)
MKRRTLLGSAVLGTLGAALTGIPAMARGNAYYSGPASDHFDGTVFFNPGKPWTKGPGDMLRWQFSREGKEAWPEHVPSPFQDKPPERVSGRRLRVTHVGHASFLLQAGGLNLLIDPVWSERASPVAFAGPRRVNAPGIRFEDLPPIDVVLVTHNHYDHLDMATLGRLGQAFAPRIVTPLGNDTIMRQGGVGGTIEAHDWGERVPLSEQIAVNLVETYHWSARGLFDRRHALWAGFAIETPAGLVYHIGDTGFGDGRPFRDLRSRHGAPVLAHIPIGAYEPRWFMQDQHVNPDEAVQIMQMTGARHALGHHWGTFKLTDEGVERPVQALATAREARGIDPDRFRAMRPGEVFTLGS